MIWVEKKTHHSHRHIRKVLNSYEMMIQCSKVVILSVPQEEYDKAMQWYESTLKLQPEFGPAKHVLRTIQCHLLMKKQRRSP